MNTGDEGAFGIELLNSILNAAKTLYYQGMPFECHADIPQARCQLATWRAEERRLTPTAAHQVPRQS
jgi:hypothetical protein